MGIGEMGLLKKNGTGESGWTSRGNEMDTRDVESVDGGTLVGLDADSAFIIISVFGLNPVHSSRVG